MLDLGYGNGRLLARAQERGCAGTGITISSSQVDACRAEGLDVQLCAFGEATGRFEAGTFDVVVLNGPTEHFVTELAAAAGRDHKLCSELFEIIEHLPGSVSAVTPGT